MRVRATASRVSRFRAGAICRFRQPVSEQAEARPRSECFSAGDKIEIVHEAECGSGGISLDVIGRIATGPVQRSGVGCPACA